MYHYIFKLFSQSHKISEQEKLIEKMYEFSRKYFDGMVFYHFPRIFFFDTLLDPSSFKSWFNTFISEFIPYPKTEFGYRLFESHKIKEVEPHAFDPILEYGTTQLIKIFWLDLYGYQPKSFKELLEFDTEHRIGLKKVLKSIGLIPMTDKELDQLLYFRHLNDKYLFQNLCYFLTQARKNY